MTEKCEKCGCEITETDEGGEYYEYFATKYHNGEITGYLCEGCFNE